MFRVIVGLEDHGYFENFTRAFRALYYKFHEMTGGKCSVRFPETVWMEYEFQDDKLEKLWSVMNFYQARDFAHSFGLLKDEIIQDDIQEPPSKIVELAFIFAMGANCGADESRDLEVMANYIFLRGENPEEAADLLLKSAQLRKTSEEAIDGFCVLIEELKRENGIK